MVWSERFTAHASVHEVDLQPKGGRDVDHVAADGTVIKRNDEQCWQCAAVDPESNDLLHAKSSG